MNNNRRRFIKGSLLAGVATMVPNITMAEKKVAGAKKVMTVAHITDVHLAEGNQAPERFANCLQKIKEHQVDLFLNGGDSIMAADYGDITRERVHEQWGLWHTSRKLFAEYEMYACLGNHDMWWAAPSKEDEMYGKNYAMQQLKMPAAYYSFNKNGWHFIVLDSNNDGGGALGETQMQWLENDLASLPKGTPVLVMSHYPILAVSTIVVGGNHKDSKPITKLFYKHPDKKIHCISGHVHLYDSAVYNNVHYYCNGSVSGYWWGDGDEESAQKYYYQETPPGYTIIELYDDGTMINIYYPY